MTSSKVRLLVFGIVFFVGVNPSVWGADVRERVSESQVFGVLLSGIESSQLTDEVVAYGIEADLQSPDFLTVKKYMKGTGEEMMKEWGDDILSQSCGSKESSLLFAVPELERIDTFSKSLFEKYYARFEESSQLSINLKTRVSQWVRKSRRKVLSRSISNTKDPVGALTDLCNRLRNMDAEG